MTIVSGRAYYAKIVGDAPPGYNNGPAEWTIDLALNDVSRAKIVEDGFEDKIKNKGDDRGDYITFKRKAQKLDGSDAKPIVIKDAQKNDWDNRLIGNGSKVNVKYVVNEWNFGKKSGTRPAVVAIQVAELVPYVGKDDFDAIEADPSDEAW